MADTDIPDVDETDLTRDELEEVARDLGVDPGGMDDQELLERLGVELGELDGADTSADRPEDDGSADGGTAETRDADDGERQDKEQQMGTEASRSERLRAKVAARLQGAAEKVRPGDDDGDERLLNEDGDERPDDEGSEQSVPGEPIEGPTRDELRDRLRQLDLPVSGTKEELLERLEGAEGGEATDGDGDGESDSRSVGGLRGRVAEKFDDAADRLRTSGDKHARRQELKAKRRELIRARRDEKIDAAKSFARQLRGR